MLVRGEEIPFEELELPEILYKYRRWDRPIHRTILTEAKFMYERPYEMCPYTELQYDLKIIQGQQLFDFYRDRVAKRFKRLNAAEQFKIAREEFRISKFHNSKLVNDHVLELFNNFDATYGALCLGENSVSTRLWDHFGSSGYGFCVGLAPRIIARSSTHGGVMQYYASNDKPLMNFPSLDPAGYVKDIINIFFSLPERFRDEIEYRFFRRSPGPVQMEREAIREVIIGYAMNNDNKAELIDIVSQRLPNAAIFQSELDPDTGKISVTPIV